MRGSKTFKSHEKLCYKWLSNRVCGIWIGVFWDAQTNIFSVFLFQNQYWWKVLTIFEMLKTDIKLIFDRAVYVNWGDFEWFKICLQIFVFSKSILVERFAVFRRKTKLTYKCVWQSCLCELGCFRMIKNTCSDVFLFKITNHYWA